MKINCSPFARLTPDQIAAWSRLQESGSSFDSPYFRPEFAQAVNAKLGEVDVAVFESDGEPVGFWPFQRRRPNVATAVGGGLCDFQGVIAREGLVWRAEEMLSACDLTAWDFDHLLASQAQFQRHHVKKLSSPYMDLTGGFEPYSSSIHAQTLSQILRKARKLQREVGELRLVPHTGDATAFERLVEWKRGKHGISDADAAFLNHLLHEQHDAFAGMLTALYAAETLVAVHFGMRSRHVLHCWFPAYNPAMQKYSPGLVMWIELARCAESIGLRRVDLGPDRGKTGQYKSSLMSGATELAVGFVARRPHERWSRLTRYAAREWAQTTRLRQPARWLRDHAAVLLARSRQARKSQEPTIRRDDADL